MSETTPAPTLGSAIAELRAHWGWIVGFGVLLVICGVIGLLTVVVATVVTVLYVAIMMLVAGVAEIAHGIRAKTWDRTILWVIIGALYLAAGILTIFNPLLAASVLTLLLAIGLIIAGVVRIVLALRMSKESTWWGVIISGIITILVGAVILIGWPASSLYVLGVLLSVDLLFTGVSWISFGMGLRSRQPAAA